MVKKLLLFTILLWLVGTAQADIEVSITWEPLQEQIAQNHNKLHAWRSFIKQLGVAFAIHYGGQTVTNTIYTTNPAVKNSLIRPILSLTQLFFASDVTSDSLDSIAAYDKTRHYGWAHFWGWLCATTMPKVSLLGSRLPI